MLAQLLLEQGVDAPASVEPDDDIRRGEELEQADDLVGSHRRERRPAAVRAVSDLGRLSHVNRRQRLASLSSQVPETVDQNCGWCTKPSDW